MKGMSTIVFLATLATHSMAQQPCALNAQPQLIKPIDNWSIIAYNIAVINTAPYFSGPHLSYSMTHTPINTKNAVSIDSSTGELKVDAATKDNFDLNIIARNSCGSVTSTFNIQIDEEQ